MGTNINLLVNGKYSKVSAENILKDLKNIGEETENKFYNFDNLDFVEIKEHSDIEGFNNIYVAKTLPYLSFNIKSNNYDVLSNLNHMIYDLKEFLKEFTSCLDSTSSKLIIDYFMDKIDVVFSEVQSTNSITIPVFIEQPITMFSVIVVKGNIIQSVSNNMYFSKEKSSERYLESRNILSLPNQYPDGELCLGRNRKEKTELDKYEFNEDYIYFFEGYFNNDLSKISSYTTCLFQNLYNGIKKFAVVNLHSENNELKKVSEKIIEILKKETTSESLLKYVLKVEFDEFWNKSHKNDIFNNSYYYYLLLSLFLNDN